MRTSVDGPGRRTGFSTTTTNPLEPFRITSQNIRPRSRSANASLSVGDNRSSHWRARAQLSLAWWRRACITRTPPVAAQGNCTVNQPDQGSVVTSAEDDGLSPTAAGPADLSVAGRIGWDEALMVPVF